MREIAGLSQYVYGNASGTPTIEVSLRGTYQACTVNDSTYNGLSSIACIDSIKNFGPSKLQITFTSNWLAVGATVGVGRIDTFTDGGSLIGGVTIPYSYYGSLYTDGTTLSLFYGFQPVMLELKYYANRISSGNGLTWGATSAVVAGESAYTGVLNLPGSGGGYINASGFYGIAPISHTDVILQSEYGAFGSRVDTKRRVYNGSSWINTNLCSDWQSPSSSMFLPYGRGRISAISREAIVGIVMPGQAFQYDPVCGATIRFSTIEFTTVDDFQLLKKEILFDGSLNNVHRLSTSKILSGASGYVLFFATVAYESNKNYLDWDWGDGGNQKRTDRGFDRIYMMTSHDGFNWSLPIPLNYGITKFTGASYGGSTYYYNTSRELYAVNGTSGTQAIPMIFGDTSVGVGIYVPTGTTLTQLVESISITPHENIEIKIQDRT